MSRVWVWQRPCTLISKLKATDFHLFERESIHVVLRITWFKMALCLRASSFLSLLKYELERCWLCIYMFSYPLKQAPSHPPIQWTHLELVTGWASIGVANPQPLLRVWYNIMSIPYRQSPILQPLKGFGKWFGPRIHTTLQNCITKIKTVMWLFGRLWKFVM